MAEARRTRSQAVPTDRRRQISEGDRDPKRQRIILAVISISLLGIVGIIVAGFVIKYVLPSRELVVRVNDVKFTRGDMVKYLRMRQSGSELYGLEWRPSTEIFDALQILVENEIMGQLAPRYGLTISEDDIDLQIKGLFLTEVENFASLEPQQLELELKENYRSYLNATGLSDQEHRDITKSSLVRSRFRDFIGERVPTVAEQVHYHRIVVGAGDEIDIMQAKYKDATASALTAEEYQSAFKDVVREFSRDDSETVRLGGDQGWLPRNVLIEYEDALYSLEIGKLSQPLQDVENPTVTLFFMVSERAENRELDPKNLAALQQRALQEWLNEERENHDIFAEFDSEIYDWLVAQLRESSQATPTPTRPPLGIPGV